MGKAGSEGQFLGWREPV